MSEFEDWKEFSGGESCTVLRGLILIQAYWEIRNKNDPETEPRGYKVKIIGGHKYYTLKQRFDSPAKGLRAGKQFVFENMTLEIAKIAFQPDKNPGEE